MKIISYNGILCEVINEDFVDIVMHYMAEDRKMSKMTEEEFAEYQKFVSNDLGVDIEEVKRDGSLYLCCLECEWIRPITEAIS